MARRKKRSGLGEMSVTFEPGIPTIPNTRKRTKKSPDEDRYNREFGARIEKVRKQRGKTQQEIADELRIGKFQYLRHETGDTAFPPYLLVTLAGLLDKSLSWLITGRG